jgi:putative ABC transport system permease protein
MGASIPSAMLTVSLDIDEKINYEFRKFGANLLVVPKSDTIDVGIGDVSLSSVTDQRYINETDIYKIKTISWARNVLGYAPFLYQVVTAEAFNEQQQVVLVGTWFEKNTTLDDGRAFKTGVQRINSWWWKIEGDWINDSITVNSTGIINCMIGITVADKMDLKLGDSVEVSYIDNSIQTILNLNVSGIINSGGTDDNHIFVSLPIAQSLTNRNNKVHTVQVSALCTACPIETIANEIEGKISYIEAKTILQTTNAEMNVLTKINGIMMLVTTIALLATILGVSTTLTTSVLERQTEIGLMKSIGADNKKIAILFIAEAVVIGLSGSVFGFLMGLVGAQIVGITVFNSFVRVQPVVLPIVTVIALSVSLIASLLPVRRAIKIDPIVVLRGD